MLSDAQRFWDAIAGKVKQVAHDITQNTFRCERYEVTTAPNGTTIGVTLPMGTREIFLPYSKEVVDATVGQQVLVVWWGSMSNAKVYYFADGYRGYSVPGFSPLDAYPIGAIYISTSSTNPGTIFGGTWQRIQDSFLLAAGSSYTAGSTGGEATHTLTVNEMPAHRHRLAVRGYNYSTSDDAITNDSYNYSAGTQAGWAGVINESTGGGGAHNNMPPYLAVYMWKRTA